MPDFLLVRVKPYNPRAGLKVQTYTYKGHRFRESAGWYRVPKALGEELRDVLQDETDPLSQSVFDVLSEEQAARVEEAELSRRERASAVRPNSQPNLRPNDPRRRSVAAAGTVTTAELQAPNDEYPPNGYPPPRVYPMPQPSGTMNKANFVDAPFIEEDADQQVFDEAAAQGVDDKTLSVSAANIARDQQGVAPLIVDGQGVEGDEFNVEAPGDTDFGPDSASDGEHEDGEERPASPPSGRRRRRS